MFNQRPAPAMATCPFNSNHTFAKEKLIFHINRCKDRAKVAHLYASCKYNGLHFVKKEQLEDHELYCQDADGFRKIMESMRRSYDIINRERERSREKKKVEEDKHKDEEDNQDDDDQCTLSECEECMETLSKLNIKDYPKLEKYIKKYEELQKSDSK